MFALVLAVFVKKFRLNGRTLKPISSNFDFFANFFTSYAVYFFILFNFILEAL